MARLARDGLTVRRGRRTVKLLLRPLVAVLFAPTAKGTQCPHVYVHHSLMLSL
jgi:hypothetical protein